MVFLSPNRFSIAVVFNTFCVFKAFSARRPTCRSIRAFQQIDYGGHFLFLEKFKSIYKSVSLRKMLKTHQKIDLPVGVLFATFLSQPDKQFDQKWGVPPPTTLLARLSILGLGEVR